VGGKRGDLTQKRIKPEAMKKGTDGDTGGRRTELRDMSKLQPPGTVGFVAARQRSKEDRPLVHREGNRTQVPGGVNVSKVIGTHDRDRPHTQSCVALSKKSRRRSLLNSGEQQKESECRFYARVSLSRTSGRGERIDRWRKSSCGKKARPAVPPPSASESRADEGRARHDL